MKVTNGTITEETNDFLKGIWLRQGFWLVDESAPHKEAEPETEEVPYQELRRIAKAKGINTHGMKREEIEQAIENA
jgi:hypothetical protein